MATIAGGALLGLIAVVFPLAGRARFARFQRDVGDPDARRRLYLAGLPMKYGFALAAGLMCVVEARRGYALPFFPPSAMRCLIVVPLLGGCCIGTVRLRTMLHGDADDRRRAIDALRHVGPLVPRTTRERQAWAVAAVSAGVTEEVMYRAFAMTFVADVARHDSVLVIALVPALLFGLAHLYQGVRGIVLTACLGLVLAAVAVVAGLLAAIVVHSVIDLRLLTVPVDAVEVEVSPR